MYKIVGGKKIYDQDISCVVSPVDGRGGIYIGNVEAAQNLQTLKKFNIKSVLTACVGVFLTHPKSQVPFYLYVPAQDHEKFDISKYFNQAINFIEESLLRTNILVHCMAGISRSVCLVLSYLIKKKNLSFEQAYRTLKFRRKIIHPNLGFVEQLKKLQKNLKKQKQTDPNLLKMKTKIHTSQDEHEISFQKKSYPSLFYSRQTNKNRSSIPYENTKLQEQISEIKNKSMIADYNYMKTKDPKTIQFKDNLSSANTKLQKWFKMYKETNTPKFHHQKSIPSNNFNSYVNHKPAYLKAYENIDQQIQEIRKRYFGDKQNDKKREVLNKSTFEMRNSRVNNIENKQSSYYDKNVGKSIGADWDLVIKNDKWLGKSESISLDKRIRQDTKIDYIKPNYRRTSNAFANIENSFIY